MKEIVLWQQWEQMCCLSSCALYKHTGRCGASCAFVYILTSGPSRYQACLGPSVLKVHEESEREEGSWQLQDNVVAIIASHHFRVCWLFPQGNSLYLLMGMCAHVWELCTGGAKSPKQTVYSPQAAALPALLFNRETQSWAFFIWSLCGRNQCGLEDRAGE